MPDIGASELLLILVVAVLVIGPKDLPLAMRTAGRWIGKMRKLTGHFRAGMDAMIREAEMEEMEKKWAAQNQRIMREHPDSAMADPAMEPGEGAAALTESKPAPVDPAAAEAKPSMPSADSSGAAPASAEGGAAPDKD